MPRPRVLIADDHPLILEGFRRILEPHYEIVGTAADGRGLVAAAERLRPDVVLLDIGMPLLNGIEAARQIRASLPKTRLVVVTQQAGRQYIQAAFRAGVSAYVVKQSAAADLLSALGDALDGRYYITPALTKEFPEALLDPRRNPAGLFASELTPRQREVLQLLAEGKSAKEIAAVLKISAKTVEFHKASIMDELGLRTTAELTRYAVANGIVDA
ncbi:MAG: response regulator transcription factor [Acidobacteriia bacterium]|nr:response regulator transcription factor [Terriglobia bacterium]